MFDNVGSGFDSDSYCLRDRDVAVTIGYPIGDDMCHIQKCGSIAREMHW